MAATPYRSGDDAPRYVCIVCFEAISMGPGPCSRCSAPLSSLDDLEVVTEVRNRAVRERAKINRNKLWTVLLPSIVLSAGLFFGLSAAGIPVDRMSSAVYGGGFLWFPMLSMAVLVTLLGSIYPRVFKQTQARLKFDPVNADLPSVLEWLGLRVEGKKAGR